MKCNASRIRFLGIGILFGIGALAFAAVIAFLFGWILMLLWNWLMPAIFGLTTISYLQAWGLILLSHLLFKGGGPGGHHHHPPVSHGRRSRRRGHLFGPRERPPRSREEMDAFKREFRDRMRRHWYGDPHDEECCADRYGGDGGEDKALNAEPPKGED